MSRYCPPDTGGDPRTECYAHCRNAVAPYLAPDRYTPLRPTDFDDCMQNCSECSASRTLWETCVEDALSAHPMYRALVRRVSSHGCPQCRHLMHAMEDYYVDRCFGT
jgi:hypothetical protein